MADTSSPARADAGMPIVSVVVPAYNEAALVKKNLSALCQYIDGLREYRWEVVFVNDGSTDETGRLAEDFAQSIGNVRVLHHPVNLGLGHALRTAFRHCRGDYVVTMDLDLSYRPEHIGALLDRIRRTKAKIVVASPYMEGGTLSRVPWLRGILSVGANRFLSVAARGSLSTLTGMVRAYDGEFVRGLHLRSAGMEINPEIVQKAILLGAAIEEIPGHLEWSFEETERAKRRSSTKILKNTTAVLLSGFLFRPVIFFIVPGVTLLLFALYVTVWMFIHFWGNYLRFPQYTWFLDRVSVALAAAFTQFPHTFLIGGIASLLAIQLISLGVLSLQNKSYFEELYSLASAIYRLSLDRERRNSDER